MGLFTAVAKGVLAAGAGVAHSLGSAFGLAADVVKLAPSALETGAKAVGGIVEGVGEGVKQAAEILKPK